MTKLSANRLFSSRITVSSQIRLHLSLEYFQKGTGLLPRNPVHEHANSSWNKSETSIYGDSWFCHASLLQLVKQYVLLYLVIYFYLQLQIITGALP